MSGNASVKKRLIKKYGNVCFIEELGVRDKKLVQREIRRYTSNKKQREILDQLTFHHIIERCKGGKATEENGALLRNINHQWFNRLSKEQQAQLNRLFQEYKRLHSQECTILVTDCIKLDFKVVPTIFEIEDKTKKPKFNRAKVKKDFNERLKEGYEEYLEEKDDLEL